MKNPNFVEVYRSDALSLIKKGCVGEVIFSEGTYQVEIKDPQGETFWPFLQIDDKGNILDAFCTCQEEEDEKCKHLAAAFLKVSNRRGDPLHVRFRRSLWNMLGQMACRRQGDNPKILKKEQEGRYSSISVTKKKLFEIQALTDRSKGKLEEVVEKRIAETEETSLKFSKLSMEEIALWKKGKASFSLVYELSFWSDIAKWLFLLQEDKKNYWIEFVEGEGVPRRIKIFWEEIKLEFYISKANWPSIIPSLITVQSPLKVYDFRDQLIDSIEFDTRKVCFRIKKRKAPFPPRMHKISPENIVGQWYYVAGDGFYQRSFDPLLKAEIIPKEEIDSILTTYVKTFKKFLKGAIIQDPMKVNYQLFFDQAANFHIKCYLFEPRDLDQRECYYFGTWAYLKDKGFYPLEDQLFFQKEKVIPKEEVSDFINRHRIWLHKYEGFQTHVGSLESRLTYILTDEDTLKFKSEVEVPEGIGDILDLDEWIYIKGRGFYGKKEGVSFLPISRKLEIKKGEIAQFITSYKEELEQISSFFSPLSPIEKLGLNISLNTTLAIVVKPEYKLAKGVDFSDLKFFDSYIYHKGRGFFEIPPSMRLPSGYEREMIISPPKEAFFLRYEIDRLKPYILFLDPRLTQPQALVLKVNKISREEKKVWKTTLSYESEIGKIDAVDIWTAFQERRKYFFSDAGLLFLLQPRFNWLRNLDKERVDIKRSQIELTSLEWLRLSVLEDIVPPEGKRAEVQETRKFLKELEKFETKEFLDISKLKGKLRPYQESGVKWLWFLYNNALSALLCDEMGLGKTHQAMALIAAVFAQSKNFKFFVVCPTSVVYHWYELLKKFLPDIKVLLYQGISRNLTDFQEKYDLLLTSYGIVRQDEDQLRALTFEIAVFDEVQIAKNYLSKTHRSLKAINAKMKLGLSGTPIENRLRELKSLFDLLLPFYLPKEATFREFFVIPIEKNRDEERKNLLSRLVKPFILRRMKKEVLLDLPEKIEEIIYCDLSEEQKELYKDTLFLSQKGLVENLRDPHRAVDYIHIFALFSKLKQICNHPSLILKDFSSHHRHRSGKWELFVELLNETRDSNQKLVVFSQYLDMLSIIEGYLKRKKIGFAAIKGSTKNRHEQIKKFREDPKCEVFVASLLAGGMGIDLSAGSVVIHYDRWWNPAKENQATDRVHRIGQSRGVQVFKLVVKNTIEEHIHTLIEKKRGLIEETIGKDDSEQIKYLSRDELLAVLEKMSQEVELL